MQTMQENTTPAGGPALTGGLTFPFPTMEQLRAKAAADQAQAEAANSLAGALAAAEGSDPALVGQPQKSIAETKTRKPRAAAAKKPKPPAKPRTKPLPLGERFKIADCIRQADPAETDTALAARISPFLSRPVNAQLVGKYREEMGLPPVKEESRAVLRARIAELERQVALAKQGKLELAGGGEPGDPTDEVAAGASAAVLAGQEGGAQ